MSYIKQ